MANKRSAKATKTFRAVCNAGEKLMNGNGDAWRDDFGDWSELGTDAVEYIDSIRRAYSDSADGFFSIGADW